MKIDNNINLKSKYLWLKEKYNIAVTKFKNSSEFKEMKKQKIKYIDLYKDFSMIK
jgi:hypothetical protein